MEAINMRLTTWTAKEILLCSTIGCAALAGAIALWIPNWYQTTAVLEVPSNQVAGLPQTLENTLTPPALATLIERHRLYADERARFSSDELVNFLRHDIGVVAVKSSTNQSTAVELRFRYSNPTVAQSVVNDLSTMLQQSAKFSLLDPATTGVLGPNRCALLIAGLFSGLLLGSLVLLLRNHYRRVSEA